MRRRTLSPRLLATAVALLGMAAVCTGDVPGDDANPALRDGGTLDFGVLGEPLTLAPYSRAASELTWVLARPVYPSLFRFAPDGAAEPYLAASAEETDGAVHVRLRDMAWSDGRPVTARDVVASARNATSPSGFLRFGQILARDRETLELRDPPEHWREALATVAFVLPDGAASVDPPVFGGPFVVERYMPGLEVVFAPNPEWSGDGPRLDRVRVQFIENLDILLGLLREGALDAAAPPSTINLAQRLREQELEFESRLGWETIFAELNPVTMTLSERIEVGNSFDRAEVVGALMAAEGRVSNTLAPSPDRDASRGPWRRARGGGSIPVEPVGIAAATGDEIMGLLQRALFRRFEGAGIEVEFLNVPPRTFYGSWRFDSPADVLLRRALGAPGLVRPRGTFADATALPLAHVETFVTWRDGVSGPAPNPTIEGPLWNMAEWGFVATD